MGVRSWRERGYRLRDCAPEYVLLWSTGYPSREVEGKADGVEKPEGNSPGHVMASGWDTTGVEERGMCPEGSLGNVGEPMRLLVENQA